ncbi:MAG: hypothetical protein H6658_12065 [Ardenticatenaceae bacterium]|nr:hypothetical protein [Ardenticatenaceae bacterium]
MTEQQQPCRVLIIHNGSLLSAGLISLFTGDEELDVRVIAPPSLTLVHKTVRHFQPAVIVFDEALLATDTASIPTLPQQYTGLKLVQVSADQDLIQIYGEPVSQQARTEEFIPFIKSVLNLAQT